MQDPKRDGHVELPLQILSQDVELYHLCPSCGNRYLQDVSIQELIDRIREGKLVDRVQATSRRPPLGVTTEPPPLTPLPGSAAARTAGARP